MKKTKLILVFMLSCFALSVYATTEPITTNTTLETSVKSVSPLCTAIAKGDLDGVKKLVELGVDVNTKSNGMAPIHYAARYNQVEIMKVLVEAGANINEKCDKGYTALKYAELSSATKAIKYIKSIK